MNKTKGVLHNEQTQDFLEVNFAHLTGGHRQAFLSSLLSRFAFVGPLFHIYL
jgi:hypothetical protein